jgi:cobalt-zinc-cadmium efflux system outer membrane protein
VSGRHKQVVSGDAEGISVLIRLVLSAILAGSAMSAHAEPLRDAFEAAAALSPEMRTLEAQRAATDARLRGANALTPGAPSVGLGYTTDRFTQNRGFREAEVEVGVPIWLPGQSRAQRGLADAEGTRLAAQIAARRLVIAAEVRDAYWAWAAADAALAAARARTASTAALTRDVARQARAGQVSRAEELLATADARESEGALREAEAAVREAQLAFRALTGRSAAPGWQESLRDGGAPSEHPRVVAARLGLDVARAGIRIAEVEDRESPEIGAFMRQERDDRDSGWDTRFGVRVRIPFAHPPRNAERRATAQGELTTASAEAAAAERLVAAERDRARAALADARAGARVAEQRHAALAEAASLGERAFRDGQATLAETLRIRTIVAGADAERRRAQVALRQAISRYNQAIGVEP